MLNILLTGGEQLLHIVCKNILKRSYESVWPIRGWGTNILLVRPAYNYSIVLIVFVLKALIKLYVRLEY